MRLKLWPLAAWSLMACALVVSLAATDGPIELGVQGRGNATPTIAADGSFVAVTWGATQASGVTDVFAAVSRDGGRRFAAPVRVNDVDGDARLNGEQPPHVALVPRAGHGPAIVVVWTTKGTNGTTLLQSRSEDGGKSFSVATLVPGTDAAGNRGWEAIAVERGGRVDAVWLDHRELARDSSLAMSHHDHSGADKPDGVAMAQQSKLYFAPLDGSATPHAVTGGVCYCCKTALVGGAGGSIYAAWRHVYPGNLRDMAFSRSTDGGRTFSAPVRVSEDKWMLEGCPDDGPSIAVDSRQRIHIVWPTLVAGAGAEPTIALFYAMSGDGEHFTPRERVPTEGMPHHPRIVVSGQGTLTLAWDESANGSRRIAVARGSVADSGYPRLQREEVTTRSAGIYPALAVAGDAVVVAWSSGPSASSSVQVARVGASPAMSAGR
ncbi:MAG: sialidase family protein [Vicinamibacterales bacterium]